MTGLDPDEEAIIEIFCIITDAKLNVLDEEGWGTVIHQSKERMDKMVCGIPTYPRRRERKLKREGRVVHETAW